MIIRSQDKRIIANLDNCMRIEVIECDGYFAIGSYESTRYARLGHYYTEEKAIKVLDMICDSYQYMKECECTRKALGVHAPEFVFQMPKDEEVETND